MDIFDKKKDLYSYYYYCLNMVKKLDYYDKKILFELDKNARITTSSLAKKIRKSKQFVDYRIKKLEQEKIIKGYTSVIDYSKLGYISMRIYFKLHNITVCIFFSIKSK